MWAFVPCANSVDNGCYRQQIFSNVDDLSDSDESTCYDQTFVNISSNLFVYTQIK